MGYRKYRKIDWDRWDSRYLYDGSLSTYGKLWLAWELIKYGVPVLTFIGVGIWFAFHVGDVGSVAQSLVEQSEARAELINALLGK